MARQLLNLRNVPEDEAEEVRDLLERHGIQYYQTPPSRWGISMGGIWLSRDDDYPRARALFDDYQAERAARARRVYAARKRSGDIETFATVVQQRPAQVITYVLGAAGIIVLMMWPVWLLLS